MSFKCLSQYRALELSSVGSYFSSLVTLHHRTLHYVTPNQCHCTRIKSYTGISKDMMFLLLEYIPKLNETEDWPIVSLTQCDTDLCFTIFKKSTKNPNKICNLAKSSDTMLSEDKGPFCLHFQLAKYYQWVVPWRKYPLFLHTESRWPVRMNPNLCRFSLTSTWFLLKITTIEIHSTIRYHKNFWRF